MSLDDDDDYGTELEYDADFEQTLQAAESQPFIPARQEPEMRDIEDIAAPTLSPFQEFRKKGFLSVSDLVATAWCEVQYDYRLRTLPFLPPEKRPQVIKSTKGVEIKVDKVKEANKEKVLKRGEKVHEKLEREIFPVKISVQTDTREDSWGLRLLTMVSSLEVLISGGKCRELPVVGLVGDMLVFGIIDEITRASAAPSLLKHKAEMRQTSIDAFLKNGIGSSRRTHTLRVSDSKTRASGTVPRAEDALGGRLQVMLYKELLDALLVPAVPRRGHTDYPSGLLPTSHGSVLAKVFAKLGLDPAAEFSSTFAADAAALVLGNSLKHGAASARTLSHLAAVWERYVADLGLGPEPTTETTLALVYRRAAATGRRRLKRVKTKTEGARGGRVRRSSRIRRAESVKTLTSGSENEPPRVQALDEDAQLQLAIQMSLAQTEPAAPAADDGSDAELQLAIQMSLRDLKDTGTAGLPVVVVDSSPDPAVVGAESSGLDGQDATEMPAVSTDEMPGRSVEVAEQTDMKLLSSKTEESPPSADPQPSVDDPTPESPLTTAAAASDSASMSSGDSSSVPISESASMASSSSSITPLIGKRRLASLGYDTDTDLEQQYDEIALAAELSQLADTTDTPGVIQVPVSSQEAKSSRSRRQSTPRREAQSQDSGDAGDIIGIAEFEHDPELLARHLSSVLAYWHGTRDPQGVSLAHVRRCGWCEFEEGCEWRAAKAEEAWKRYQSRQM